MPRKANQINCRLDDQDLSLIRSAIKHLYPDLDLSDATALLTLARREARRTLSLPRFQSEDLMDGQESLAHTKKEEAKRRK
jgi:hypothetical protein